MTQVIKISPDTLYSTYTIIYVIMYCILTMKMHYPTYLVMLMATLLLIYNQNNMQKICRLKDVQRQKCCYCVGVCTLNIFVSLRKNVVNKMFL